MTCDESARLIDAYLDGELDLATCVRVEEHLAACPACREKLESSQVLAALIADEAPRYAVSPFLETRIRAALRAEEPARSDVSEKAPWWSFHSLRWIYSGIGLAVIVIALAVYLSAPGGFSQLAREGINDHIRSLQANHLMDVASTDQHTVKPWFAGKLDYSPQVIDLKTQGYPLIGGRLDVLGGRDVAAIIYQRRLHYINLLIWPTDTLAVGDRVYEWHNYHVISWTQNGMNYMAVSELGVKELKDFSGMIRSQIVPPLE
jgi:anti-sigma factor RsiW